MTREIPATESLLSAAHDSGAESHSLSLPGVEQTLSHGKDLCSRELIARQRALVRDIREMISMTKNIVASTREQLDSINLLIGKSRRPARETDPRPEGDAEERGS